MVDVKIAYKKPKIKKRGPRRKMKAVNYEIIKQAAAAKLLIEKGIIVRGHQSFYSIAMMIIRAYGYNFEITQKQLCPSFVRKYVAGKKTPYQST